MSGKTFLVTLTTGDAVSIPASYERDWKSEARRLAETGVCDEESNTFYSARHIVSVQLQDPAQRIMREEEDSRASQQRWFPLGEPASGTP